MEIFGILILLCLLSMVAFYLKIDVIGKLSSIWDDITLAIGNKRLYYARKRETKEKIKNEAIAAAFKKVADEKARIRQTWKKIREISSEQHTKPGTVSQQKRMHAAAADMELFKTQRVGSPYGYTYTKRDMLNVQIDSLKKQIVIQGELQTKLDAISRRLGLN